MWDVWTGIVFKTKTNALDEFRCNWELLWQIIAAINEIFVKIPIKLRSPKAKMFGCLIVYKAIFCWTKASVILCSSIFQVSNSKVKIEKPQNPSFENEILCEYSLGGDFDIVKGINEVIAKFVNNF